MNTSHKRATLYHGELKGVMQDHSLIDINGLH
jgi:hypothetical protein